jgi:hypothetical protein
MAKAGLAVHRPPASTSITRQRHQIDLSPSEALNKEAADAFSARRLFWNWDRRLRT